MKPLQIDTESPRWRIYKQGPHISIAGPDTAVGFAVVPETRAEKLEAALREIEQRHGRQVAEAEAECGHTVPAECGCEDCLTIDAALADVGGES